MSLESAILAARAAGDVLRERFSGPRTIGTKSTATDLVTDADTAAEAAILAVLKSRHPNDAILAEESGTQAGTGPRWIIDPLDGTTNYAHGIPHFSVSIAREGEIGVVYDPMRNELFAAEKGKGATLNGALIAVTKTATLREAILATGFPYWVNDRPDEVVQLFAAFVREARAIRRFGSAALDLAWVACGRFDGFFELDLKPWDTAAGRILVREAGGTANDSDARVLAANPLLFPAVTAIAQPGP